MARYEKGLVGIARHGGLSIVLWYWEPQSEPRHPGRQRAKCEFKPFISLRAQRWETGGHGGRYFISLNKCVIVYGRAVLSVPVFTCVSSYYSPHPNHLRHMSPTWHQEDFFITLNIKCLIIFSTLLVTRNAHTRCPPQPWQNLHRQHRKCLGCLWPLQNVRDARGDWRAEEQKPSVHPSKVWKVSDGNKHWHLATSTLLITHVRTHKCHQGQQSCS